MRTSPPPSSTSPPPSPTMESIEQDLAAAAAADDQDRDGDGGGADPVFANRVPEWPPAASLTKTAGKSGDEGKWIQRRFTDAFKREDGNDPTDMLLAHSLNVDETRSLAARLKAAVAELEAMSEGVEEETKGLEEAVDSAKREAGQQQ